MMADRGSLSRGSQRHFPHILPAHIHNHKPNTDPSSTLQEHSGMITRAHHIQAAWRLASEAHWSDLSTKEAAACPAFLLRARSERKSWHADTLTYLKQGANNKEDHPGEPRYVLPGKPLRQQSAFAQQCVAIWELPRNILLRSPDGSNGAGKDTCRYTSEVGMLLLPYTVQYPHFSKGYT